MFMNFQGHHYSIPEFCFQHWVQRLLIWSWWKNYALWTYEGMKALRPYRFNPRDQPKEILAEDDLADMKVMAHLYAVSLKRWLIGKLTWDQYGGVPTLITCCISFGNQSFFVLQQLENDSTYCSVMVEKNVLPRLEPFHCRASQFVEYDLDLCRFDLSLAVNAITCNSDHL